MKKLKPKTDYSIRVRLFNTAGHSERKLTMMMRQLSSRSKSQCNGHCSPSIWIIIGIIFGIIIIVIIFFVILILVCKPNRYQNPRGS